MGIPFVTSRPFWSALFALSLLLSTASSQVVFTITGTMTSNAGPFTQGEEASFVFTLNPYIGENATGTVSPGSYVLWNEFTTSDPQLWESVSGTDLEGMWTRPNLDTLAPNSTLIAYETNGELILSASKDSGNNGLSLKNGYGLLKNLKIDAKFAGLDFGLGSELTDPNTFFQNYAGTYSASQTVAAFISNDVGVSYDFTVSELTISFTPTAVPEPTTALLMLAGLALCLTRRPGKKS